VIDVNMLRFVYTKHSTEQARTGEQKRESGGSYIGARVFRQILNLLSTYQTDKKYFLGYA